MASIDHMPDQVEALTGLRGLFRQGGTMVEWTVPTTLATRSMHPGEVLKATFWLSAAVFAVALRSMPQISERSGAW